MKPIKDCKQQEQDYRQKMSACNVSYRHKRSGPKGQISYELLPSSVICFLCANFITYVVPTKQLCFMLLPGLGVGGGGGVNGGGNAAGASRFLCP